MFVRSFRTRLPHVAALLLGASLAFVGTGCGGGSSSHTAAAPTFSGGVKPLIDEYGCFSCHMTTSWDNGESLTDAQAIITHLTTTKSEECATLPYITPGSPDDSYMYQKVMGKGSCFTGDRMPKGGNAIDEDDAANLKAWITAGAQNN